MKIRIEKATLLQGLNLAQGIADRKATMPILANVLLRTNGRDRVVVVATDLNITVINEIPCEVLVEGGFTVGAKQLHDIVKLLPKDHLTLSKADNNYAEISAGKVNYKVVGLADADFPQLPNTKEVAFFGADPAVLKDLVTKTFFSVSTDETRYHLNGALFESDGCSATMVSTDGLRLSKYKRDLPEGPTILPGVLIPRKGLMELRKVLDNAKDTVSFGIHQGHLFLRTQLFLTSLGAGRVHSTLSVKLQDAVFPPYTEVIPKDQPNKVVAWRAMLLDALKRISVVAAEDTHGIRVILTPGLLRIETDNSALGQASEELEVDYRGAPLTLGFNAKFLIEAISEVDSLEVVIGLKEDTDPVVFRNAVNAWLGVVMPMRL